MPTYQYKCKNSHVTEIRQKFGETLETCPVCGEPVKRVIGQFGVVYNTSGFYSTDNRK